MTLLESYLVLLLWIAGISGVCAIAALIADLINYATSILKKEEDQ